MELPSIEFLQLHFKKVEVHIKRDERIKKKVANRNEIYEIDKIVFFIITLPFYRFNRNDKPKLLSPLYFDNKV